MPITVINGVRNLCRSRFIQEIFYSEYGVRSQCATPTGPVTAQTCRDASQGIQSKSAPKFYKLLQFTPIHKDSNYGQGMVQVILPFLNEFSEILQ